MRFRVSCAWSSKILFGGFSRHPSKSWADLDVDRIDARAGWARHVTIAR